MFRTHLLRQDTLAQPKNILSHYTILTFSLLTFLVYNRFRRVTLFLIIFTTGLKMTH